MAKPYGLKIENIERVVKTEYKVVTFTDTRSIALFEKMEHEDIFSDINEYWLNNVIDIDGPDEVIETHMWWDEVDGDWRKCSIYIKDEDEWWLEKTIERMYEAKELAKNHYNLIKRAIHN
jgi:hypothetical protein